MKASNLLLAIYFNMVKIVYIVQDNTKFYTQKRAEIVDIHCLFYWYH